MRQAHPRLRRRPLGRVLLATLTAALTTGCGLAPPQAWEKDLLSRPAMSMDDDPLDARNRQHITLSKEGSSGGHAVGGGGCGCN